MEPEKLKRIFHLASGLIMVFLGCLSFFLTRPPNATLLLPVFYGLVFLISFPIWIRELKYTAVSVAFLYLTLMMGLLDPVLWSFNNGEWIVFSICLLMVVTVALNLWQQWAPLLSKWNTARKEKKSKKAIRTSQEQHP